MSWLTMKLDYHSQIPFIWVSTPILETLRQACYASSHAYDSYANLDVAYASDEEGNFGGQHGYGYISFEKFVDACQAVREGNVTLDDLDRRGLPTLNNTIATGAILEAGRISLDEQRPVEIIEKDGVWSLE